jgi:hypothetical protein
MFLCNDLGYSRAVTFVNMKTEFVPPMNGQVIGTHNATAFVYFMSRSRVYIAIGLLLLYMVSVLLGEELSRKDFFPLL